MARRKTGGNPARLDEAPTEKQVRVLQRVLCWYYEREEIGLAEVAGELGIGYMTLRGHLEALDAKGLLIFRSRGPGRAPVVKPMDSGLGYNVRGGTKGTVDDRQPPPHNPQADR